MASLVWGEAFSCASVPCCLITSSLRKRCWRSGNLSKKASSNTGRGFLTYSSGPELSTSPPYREGSGVGLYLLPLLREEGPGVGLCLLPLLREEGPGVGLYLLPLLREEGPGVVDNEAEKSTPPNLPFPRGGISLPSQINKYFSVWDGFYFTISFYYVLRP